MSAPTPATEPPRRVRVTSPRTSAPRSRRVTPASEIDRRTALGELYLRSLLRAQLRLGVRTLLVAVGLLGALPLLFRLAPGLSEVTVLDMPLSWALLAFAVYPFLVCCGWGYVRRAERNERAFTTMVEPPGPARPADEHARSPVHQDLRP